MPDRVILPLYFGEAAIYLTVMLVAIVTVEQKSIWKKAGAVFACMILIFMGYQSGRQQYRFLKSQNEGMEQYMQGLVELYDSRMQLSDGFFFVQLLYGGGIG